MAALAGPVIVTAIVGGSSPKLVVDLPVVRTRLPSPAATLIPGPAPPGTVRLPVSITESCVGRTLPTDRPAANGLPAAISGQLDSPWRCDGDGARIKPPQSASIRFRGPRTVSAISVFGYDVAAPCRFVTRIEILLGNRAYALKLPANRYRQLLWFRFPPIKVTTLTVAVTATATEGARTAPGCARTSIAGLSFAGPAHPAFH